MHFIYLGILFYCLSGCLKAESVNGSWSAVYEGSLTLKAALEFSDNTLSAQYLEFSDNQFFKGDQITFVSHLVNSKETEKNIIFEIDLELRSFAIAPGYWRLSPQSSTLANYYNFFGYCGFKDWVESVYKDVTGLHCGEPVMGEHPESFPSAGTKIFTAYLFDKSSTILYRGVSDKDNDGSTPAKRHNKFNNVLRFYRK